jgi:uncharacterized membrane-anchored protein YhcB (DUF1043 family)
MATVERRTEGAGVMPDSEAGDARRFRLDALSGAIGGVLGAAIIGLVVWAFGLQSSVGDLDARTKAHETVLQQTTAILNENAKQIAAQQHQLEKLSASVERLVTDSAEQRQAIREELSRFAAESAEQRQATHDELSRLIADSAEERRAAREDLKELRDLTRENSQAIRDLLSLAPRPPAPGRS